MHVGHILIVKYQGRKLRVVLLSIVLSTFSFRCFETVFVGETSVITRALYGRMTSPFGLTRQLFQPFF